MELTTKKKHLVILTDSFLPRWDGIARMLNEIIPRLSSEYQITVLAPDFGSIQYEGVTIHKIALSKITLGDYQFPKCSLALGRIIKDADLVFSHTFGPIGATGILFAKHYQKPILHYMHVIDWELSSKSIGKYQSIIRTITKYYARYLYNKCSVIIVPYPEALEILKKNKVLKPHKAVVHLGVSTAKFCPVSEEQKQAIRKTLGIPQHALVIGYVGRIAREKGISLLLEAFTKLQKTHDHLHLVLVGKGVPSLIKSLTGMRSVSHFIPTGDIVQFLQALDIFVLPSYTETTSLVTLEAMACEKIVIAANVGYVKDYLEEKDNGLLFPRGNAAALEIKLRAVVENPKKYAPLGQRARQTVQQRFNWEETVAQLKALFKQY
ncbi:MAG: glycosyltransferase family 4 protein [Candidatus Woesearchaeota archaeon]